MKEMLWHEENNYNMRSTDNEQGKEEHETLQNMSHMGMKLNKKETQM
jgi:hypothetical protein